MGRRAKPAKRKREAKRTPPVKSRKNEGPGVGDLKKRLAEALKREAAALELLETRRRELSESQEQQMATSDILRVIASSPTDAQPVFDTILASATALLGAFVASLTRRVGDDVHMAAFTSMGESLDATVRLSYPVSIDSPNPHSVAIRRCEPHIIADADTQADIPEPVRRMARARGWRSNLAVPLRRAGTAIGALGVSRREAWEFTPEEVALLQTFADQAVIAIENVRLFTELQTSNRELTTALDTQTATSNILSVISRSQTDVQPVFEAIADSAMRLFEPWAVAIERYDGELIRMVAARGGLPGSAAAALTRFQEARRPTRGDPPEEAVLTATVRHVLDVQTDPSCSPEFRVHASKRGVRSLVAVPMLRGSVPLGAITVSHAQPSGFSSGDIALLQTFADQAVIAVENARLLGELQARTAELQHSVRQLTALGEVGQAVSASLDLETVLTTIVSQAVQLSGLDGGVVFEYDEAVEAFVQRAATQTQTLTAAARVGLRKGEGVVGRTALTLEPVQVPDIAAAGAYEGRARASLIDAGVRALFAVPIVREGRLLGGLAVSRNRPGDFPAETVDLLRTFAAQSALAIQNARLFREIERKSHELEAASQHKSEFLANMSHELRTPLNAIIGYSEMLQEEARDRHQNVFIPDLEKINDAAKHQLSLINDILDLSKIEAGRMELELSVFHLPTAIDDALLLMRERASRRGLTLDRQLDARLGEIHADQRKVKQVLLNLLSNAVKFTPEGGRIEVRAVPVDGGTEISVTDTGSGIAPEHQEAVFEEFRQVGRADKKAEGTGLGLALCRKFVELHGGRIWVKSQLGAGSTFTFSLPVRQGG